MAFLLTLVGIMAVGYLLWRSFGPQLTEEEASDDARRVTTVKRRPRRPVGPDDDPEFLMDLDRRTRGPNGSDTDDT
ncbi:hypothetical protein ACLQ3C_11920 [Gordonia sp. DT30]|uniref:hypothetical protein n=1 Tax=unclassified Gordonia (in: high G+C Gram-positive bacteria) TaxID=2657482 RepID=UPI003CF89A6D